MKTLLKSFLSISTFAGIFLLGISNSYAATFTVNDLGDAPDAVIDGTCATAGVVCTLRAAIMEANATPASDTIEITVAGTINLLSALPFITEQTGIYGSTAPGYAGPSGPNQGGANSTGFTHDLTVSVAAPDNFTDIFVFSGSGADFSAVSGLAFHTYDAAIVIDGADGVTITTCDFGMNELEFIGGTKNTGVLVQGDSTGTNIGLNESGNLFIDHDDDAIIVTGTASGTNIEGNNIGINKDSTTLTAGGDTNISDGIYLTGTSTGTTIHFNRIDSNGAHGINIDTAVNTIITANIIGAGLGDVDRGNGGSGIVILSTGTSSDRIGTNGDGVNDANEGNTIVGNTGSGIILDADSTNTLVVAGNYIGETRSATNLGNDVHGIYATGTFGGTGARIGSDNNGTSDTEEGNLINNNGMVGLYLEDTADNFVVRDNTIDDNVTRGIQNGTAGAPAGPYGTVIDRNTVSEHGPGIGTNGIGIENGTFTTLTRNTLLNNRVGFSIDFFNGATAIVGGASAALGNDFSGSTIDGAHIHDTNSSAVHFQNNTFGANGANLVNLSIRSHNVRVGGTGFGNTFYEPQAGGRHVEIFDESIGTDPEGNRIDTANTFQQPAVAPFFMAVDLYADGPTAVQGIYPNVGDPNRAIDVVQNLTQTPATLTITGDSEPNAVLIIHDSPTTDAGIAENYLTTATATGAGTFSVDLTGFASFGQIVAVSQYDPLSDDSSEFVAVELIGGGGGGGGTRRRDTNIMVTHDYTAPLGEPSELLQGIDLDQTTPLTGISYTSLDTTRDVQIQSGDNRASTDSQFASILTQIQQFLTAMIWGESMVSFSGSGSGDYFIPLEAGEYVFEAHGIHASGSDTFGTFTVTVIDTTKGVPGTCSAYSNQNLYWQGLEAITTCDTALQSVINDIVAQTKASIPAECLTTSLIPPPQVSCSDRNTCVNPDYAMLKKIYLEALQPQNFQEIFPNGSPQVENLINHFVDLYEQKEKGESEGFEGIPKNACGYEYKYYDFPGEYRFGKYDVANVLLVYELRNIFSGLISDQLLAPYLNLIRSHAIIATFRTYNDSNGLFWMLADEKDLDSNHVDVREDDVFKSIFKQYANGYSLEEALIAAMELKFVSQEDLKFLTSRVLELQASGQQESPKNRYLLPTSDIQKIDLIALVDSVLDLSNIFPSDGRSLELEAGFDTPEYRRLIGPYIELGLLTRTEGMGQGIPRAEAFTFFYRLQRFNHFLKGEMERYGLETGNGELRFNREVVSLEIARQLFQTMLDEQFAERDDIRKILEIGTRPVIEDFWLSLTRFLAREDEPFPSIKDIIFSSKNPVVILDQLKQLLN